MFCWGSTKKWNVLVAIHRKIRRNIETIYGCSTFRFWAEVRSRLASHQTIDCHWYRPCFSLVERCELVGDDGKIDYNEFFTNLGFEVSSLDLNGISHQIQVSNQRRHDKRLSDLHKSWVVVVKSIVDSIRHSSVGICFIKAVFSSLVIACAGLVGITGFALRLICCFMG